ncbi:MAG: ABC transporter permease [Ilumatobacter sp.]|uniref:ABC transporter permease n=1 Tax=Ilumatobacter sp. TaxID=1967498 RepID=UPI003C72A4E7
MTNVAPEIATESHQAAVAQAESLDGAGASRRNLTFILAVAWLVLVVVVVLLGWIFGDALPFLQDPTEINPDSISAGPSWSHPFGNAAFGEDVFSQVVEGGLLSLRIAALVTVLGIGIGGGMGLIAGYYRGLIDSLVRLVINVTLSVPALLLVIFIVTIRNQSEVTVIFALTLLAVPALARIVRASTLQVADREFVKAAEVLGVKRSKILLREVLPNVMPTLVSFAFLTTGIIIVVESTLSFLGLSVQAPAITWGSIIASGRIKFADAPHTVIMPSLVIFLTVLSLNFVGDQLLKRFDIKETSL